MNLYLGAENIISPLGRTAEENYTAIENNCSGIKEHSDGPGNKSRFISVFAADNDNLFNSLVAACIRSLMDQVQDGTMGSARSLIILSTTKGDIRNGISGAINRAVEHIVSAFSYANRPLVVSNACASGVIAINLAADLIKAGVYDTIAVVGCDVVSEFVVSGFQSLFAISDSHCRPFDKNRSGINLGEGCGGVVLSNNITIFKEEPVLYLAGSSSNDANHISGPSREGEGLVLAVQKTLTLAGIGEKDVDFISAHGTGTVYNDDMESIALDRLGMQHIPVNSLKGFYGHTLGAAGIIETAICVQCIKNNGIIKSYGFNEEGTARRINVVSENMELPLRTVLKTSSGFGGSNGTLLLAKA